MSRGFSSVVKHLTADQRTASSNALKLTKINKWRYVYVPVLPRTNATVYHCYTLDMSKNLVCHVWWALQYLALWAIIN